MRFGVALGRLNPARFLGGELALDTPAARRAIEQKIATPLGYEGEDGLITSHGDICKPHVAHALLSALATA